MFFSSCCNLFVCLFVCLFVWFVVILAVLLLLLWALACSIRYLVVQARFPEHRHILPKIQKDGPSHASCAPLLLTCEALGAFGNWTRLLHIPTMRMTRKNEYKHLNNILSILNTDPKKTCLLHTQNTSLRMIYLQTPQFTPQIPTIPPTPITMQPPPNTQQNQLAACA